MEFIYIFFICTIALTKSDDDTQNRDKVGFPEELEAFMRRLTQQQMQTTQNFQSSLFPHINIPRVRTTEPDRVDAPLPLLKFPFQSNEGGSRSFASSSVSVKRPQAGASNVAAQAQASAFASVDDVKNDEQNMNMGDRFTFDDGISSGRSSLPSEIRKSTTIKEEFLGISDDDSPRKGEPVALKHQQVETVFKADDSFSDVYFVAIVAGCCAVGIFGVISAGFCFYKLQKSRKAAADVDYPAYGVTGPNKDVVSPNGDRKLAQSAQMYHYQHQKQQMIAVEKAGSTKNTSASDVDSEEENEEGDYTVYECPGLAPTGEMEVKNPLFHDDSTPVSPPILPSKPDSNQNN